MPNCVEILKEKFSRSLGIPWQGILSASTIEEVLLSSTISDAELSSQTKKRRNRFFNPIVTLWAFLYQVLDEDKSCSNAVSKIVAWLAASNMKTPSSNTGGYTKAKQRLSENFLKNLFQKTGDNLESKAQSEDLWCGRHVKMMDGSSVLMPDTSANQSCYPQHSNQSPGCGFPIAKLVVMFSLVTGAAMGVLMEAFNTSEIFMARQMYYLLLPQDVALADRAFGTYVDLALVKQRLADAVFRCHHSRKNDFKRGKRLSKNDYLVTWYKPKTRPRHMSVVEFNCLPDSQVVRQVRFQVPQSGFRTKEIIVVTTLLDNKIYTLQKIAQLYRWRWQVEIDIRHVKTTLKMEMLRGKTPDMVRKEIFVYLMAYNLLRAIMWEAADTNNVSKRLISLQTSRQYLKSFITALLNTGKRKSQILYKTMLDKIAQKLLPERSDRTEPRVIKRRQKSYPFMTKPRNATKPQSAA